MNAVERRKVWLCGSWLISAIVHFSFTAAVAVVMRPAGSGDSAANTLIVSIATADPAEMELASLGGAAVEIGLGEDLVAAAKSQGAAGADGGDHPETDLPFPEIAAPEIEVAPRNPFDEIAFQDLEVPALPPASVNRREDRPAEEEAPAARAEFFGTVARGDRFVYLLDMSGSMNDSPDAKNRSRFDRARDELLRSVDALHERQGFYVALFSDKTRTMFDGAHGRRFMPASAENKVRLRKWLAPIEPQGGTDPNESLEQGVELEPNAIFLLSDGQFTVHEPERAGLMFRKIGGNRDEIIDRSDKHRIPIHTIAYEVGSGAATMQDLSKRTGGSYRFIGVGEVEPVSAPAAPPVAATNSSPVAVRFLAAAKSEESRRHYRQALTTYRRIVAQYPDSTEAVVARERIVRLSAPGK